MLEIKAYVREAVVDDVIDALGRLQPVSGIAVVPIEAFGHSVSDDSLKAVDMVKLELEVADDAEDAVVECIVRHARTGEGHPGDGRIFVGRLHRGVRIRDSREDLF